MKAAMAIGADRDRVRNRVWASIGQMAYVVNLEKRAVDRAEWRWQVTAFTNAVRLQKNPCFDAWIS